MSLQDNLIAQILARRKYHKLSQQQLANKMGVPRTFLSKIENRRTLPMLGTLEKLAIALNTEPWRLLKPLVGSETEAYQSQIDSTIRSH